MHIIWNGPLSLGCPLQHYTLACLGIRERKNNRWRFDFSSFWFVAIDVSSLFTPRFENKICNFHFLRITTSVNIFKIFFFNLKYEWMFFTNAFLLQKWKLQFLFSNLGVNNDKTSMATNQKDEKSNRQRLFLRSVMQYCSLLQRHPDRVLWPRWSQPLRRLPPVSSR